jgi:hypothetical protein
LRRTKKESACHPLPACPPNLISVFVLSALQSTSSLVDHWAVAGVLMMEPFVPGLDHPAKEPQAPGQALTETDISPSLVGRVAEVFWPDEGNPEGSLWYLVKIESVDMIQKTASIRYQNGDMEEALSLVEVARDGHMRLLTI